MTPKNKARELIEKMIIASNEESERIGKSCALICVGEIITLLDDFLDRECLIELEYYEEVRHEINKL